MSQDLSLGNTSEMLNTIRKTITEEISSFCIGFGSEYVLKESINSAMLSLNNIVSEDDGLRRVSTFLLREISNRIRLDNLDHRAFNLDTMKTLPSWGPLVKIVLAKRLEELKTCKIVQIGKKFDITDIKKSFFGNLIAEKLGYSRRAILTNIEYQGIITQIKKINCEPPVIIKPTATEKYFGGLKD